MTVVSAYSDGARRVLHAPLLLLGTLLASWLLALPLVLAVRTSIARDLGASTAAEAAAAGVNWEWWQEFSSRASGLGGTFQPSIIGFAAPLRNLSDFVDGRRPARALTGAIAAWLVTWTFLAGGILDRLARNRATGAHGFFMAAGVHFFRFIRLGLLALVAYALLSLFVHGWMLADLYSWVTRSLTVERQAFLVRVVLYAVSGLLFATLSLVHDYARIRIVVEDRHSALGALVASIRFLRRHAVKAVGLYALNVLGFVLLLAAYAALAPGVGRAGWGTWLTLLAGQLFIVGRLWIKLQFLGSQTALFQAELAHSGYVAESPAAWPESPTAEALHRTLLRESR